MISCFSARVKNQIGANTIFAAKLVIEIYHSSGTKNDQFCLYDIQSCA